VVFLYSYSSAISEIIVMREVISGCVCFV